MSKRAARIDAFGLRPGLVVQELGWDEDTDHDLRDDIMDAIDAEMIDEAIEAVDVVVLWWRSDDGDVADGLVDALTDMTNDGYIWLLTPKVGCPGYIDPSDISEGVATAGMMLTKSIGPAADWQANRVERPKAAKR